VAIILDDLTLRDAGDAKVHVGFSRLTAKQISILEMIARGLTNPQIGVELHMSKYTVAQHIREMLKRTGSTNRTDLVSRAHIIGILRTTHSASEALSAIRKRLRTAIRA
jgi:DNA-binding NarL/FixJ family response regulator